ncbi:MAG: ATP-binding protein [Kiritimatiellae bacterium]|nr:ATP-binding protein [Kiritimatiellia bacterium]
MKRTSIAYLHKWIKNPRRKPLVLRGARQVGKSTLIRIFAKECNMTLIEINLELHRDLDEVFSTLDIKNIVLNLQSIAGTEIKENTILFLDEIQATPNALAALRYFYEEKPNIPVIAAGSLLEFVLSDHAFSMPVGRIEYLHLGPMTFSEYLLAIDPMALKSLNSLNPSQPFPLKSHQRLLQLQREFMLVGGMPEAVDVYRTTHSFEDVASVQNSICNTYLNDFSKYAKHKDLANLQLLFRSIPRIIGNKLKYGHLLPDARSAYVKEVLNLLAMARIFTSVSRSDCSGIPLAAGIDPKFSKLIFLDVGLVSRLLGVDWIDFQNLQERNFINEGSLAEQFIGQHLHWNMQTAPELYYWARESKKSNAELDYVTARGSLIVPIEVKAGKSGTLKSLHLFMQQKRLSYAFRFDLQPPSVQDITTTVTTASGQKPVSYRLFSLPLYAIDRLPALLDMIRK